MSELPLVAGRGDGLIIGTTIVHAEESGELSGGWLSGGCLRRGPAPVSGRPADDYLLEYR